MKDPIRSAVRIGLSLLGVLALAAGSAAQEQGKEEKDEKPVIDNPFAPPSANDPREEMFELLEKVGKNLKQIDARLADAGAGDAPLEEVPDSGLDDLLRQAQQDGEQVVSDIDRILELAQQLGQPQQGGGGQGTGQPSDGKSSQHQDSGAPRERERTEAPPEDGQKTPGQEEQKPPSKGGKPESPQADRDRGENEKGKTPPDPAKERAARADDADRWGDLPPRVQEIFRNQGRDDMPVQYRDWIDNYYRRLNESRRGLTGGH